MAADSSDEVSYALGATGDLRDTRASSTVTNVAAVGTARALDGAASLFVRGVPESPTAAAAIPIDTSGRTFYVNSNTGNDANDGLSSTANTTGSGPWKTLAKVSQAALAAGDTVLLACGSSWHETLTLPASGTTAHPISVKAETAGCATPPAIDGGVTLPASAWSVHSGKIYKATVSQAPLQVFATSGTFTEAHHPNKGYLSADPTSMYAAVTAGNRVSLNGQEGTNVVTTGSDLPAPAGTNLSAGARIRMRTANWLIDEATITAVQGNQLTLSTPTTYPLVAGRGYLLIGQLWMLDSAGEWHYDSSTKTLYAWLPTSAAPGATVTVSTMANGIDLTNRKNVVVDGVAVRRVGTALVLRNSDSVRIRNSVIEDVADVGADAVGAANAAFESNKFSRIGAEAITGHAATNMVVSGNVLRDIGAIVSGDSVLSLPRSSIAAIQSGTGSNVKGNTLINTGYTGIRPGNGSTIEDNFIYGACSVLDDSAGIHVWADDGVTIRRNTVIHSRGSAAGKQAPTQTTEAQGIYLDDSTTNTLVEDNTVVDADYGIQVHVSSSNTVRNNRLYGNRVGQIWMQEASTAGELSGNTVTGNQIAMVYPTSTGLTLQTGTASTAGFGTFDRNRYYDRASATIARAETSVATTTYTLDQWRRSSGVGSTQAVDVNGVGVGSGGYASYTVSGSNIVSNTAALGSGDKLWGTWNPSATQAQLVRESCTAGTCLRYVPGGAAGLISSPQFEVQAGQWYRLTIDVLAPTANQYVEIIVRRVDGNWEWLSDRNLSVTATNTWGRYSVVFQATKSAVIGSEALGEKGARLDISNLQTGLSIANVEIAPITPATFAQSSGIVVNVGDSALTLACPYTASQPALCGKLVNLADNQALAWPMTLAPHSATVFYGQEPSLIDSDGDGIPDTQDRCPSTAAAAVVDASGCSFAQR